MTTEFKATEGAAVARAKARYCVRVVEPRWRRELTGKAAVIACPGFLVHNIDLTR